MKVSRMKAMNSKRSGIGGKYSNSWMYLVSGKVDQKQQIAKATKCCQVQIILDWIKIANNNFSFAL
jgi:hypothetical protein